MSAPVDAAVGVAAAVGFVCGGLLLIHFDPWKRRMERRLAAIEAPSGSREDGAVGSLAVGAGNFEPALFELRCALSLYDVADDVVRQRSKDGVTATEGETTGRAYAAWSLAGAARRLATAYVRDTEAGVRI